MTYRAPSQDRRKGQRGTTVILFTMLCTLLLIPVAGLAIDGAIMYLMKAKLSAAVDAAALATARGLNVGQTISAQETAAQGTGSSYFNANLPPGTMGASLTSLAITFPTPTIPNTMVVKVQATISVPLTFMRLLHFQTANLSDAGQATRRVSNIILVLDRSFSLQLGSQCGNLISSSQQFVNYFEEGLDTMGLVDFQASANEDYVDTVNQTLFKTAINNYITQMQCSGYTNTAEALAVAYARLQVLNEPSANNTIVLFTDGNADSIYATFPLRTTGKTETIYNWSPADYTGWTTSASQTAVGATPCSSLGSLTGVMINLPGGMTNANDTGGIYQDTFYTSGVSHQPISWVSKYQTQGYDYPYPDNPVSGKNCNFSAASPGNDAYNTNTIAIRNDVAYLPATDATPYHNSLSGYWTDTSGSFQDLYTNGSYSGYLRVDTVQSVNDAALNDADNMAYAIRTGTARTGPSIQATIYTIGLGNPPYETVNSTFLERLANDPSAPGYTSNQPTGMYKYCTPAGLQAAFEAIASQILRLSQ